MRRLRRRLLLGIAVAAALAGATAAVVMAAQPSSAAHHHAGAHRRGHGTLATAAAYLDLNTAQLRSDLQSGKSLAQLAAGVPGKSTAGLIEALEAADRQKLAAAAAALPERVAAQVNRAGGPHPGARKAGRRGAQRVRTVSVAAQYLGLDTAELRQDLRSGKSLAQIANSTSGKSAGGLIGALLTASKAQLATRVSDGSLTQAQANELLRKLTVRLTAKVNRTPHRHAPALPASG